MEKSGQVVPSNAFYDTIADVYNNHLSESDGLVREAVHQMFAENIKAGTVLDFGGGTGLDLPWLVNNGYQVFFLEPSKGMRAQARQLKLLVADERLTPHFIEERVDIREWTKKELPFETKMNGVLANFAVVNCIQNIDEFFYNIAQVCDTSARMLLTIIDPRPVKIFKYYSFITSIKLVIMGNPSFTNSYRGVSHETYIHSIKSLRKSSAKYFDWIAYHSLKFSNFGVAILSKK